MLWKRRRGSGEQLPARTQTLLSQKAPSWGPFFSSPNPSFQSFLTLS